MFNKHLEELKKFYMTKKDKKTLKPKPALPIPFYGIVEDGWCHGVKKNHCLYTQCTKKPVKGKIYCAICQKQADNNSGGVPNCGNIMERKKQWDTSPLTYQPDGMKREIPYANLMAKLNVTREDVIPIIKKLGWTEIPECHFVVKKAKRGRPKTKIAVEDSDDEKPKKKRGRPRKIVEEEPSDDDLIKALIAGM